MAIHSLSRRKFLTISSGVLAGIYALGLNGCSSKTEPSIRIASNIWPGYELLYLAREQNKFTNRPIKLVEVPSATVCIQSLAAGTVEGAMLTLDEVISACAEGLNLKIITVLDISMGADVLLAKPGIKNIQQLRGKRIGVEKTAVGAIMLQAILDKVDFTINDIKTVYTTVNSHTESYKSNQVDALITFEPVKTQLLNLGASILFDSSKIPGQIIDVLAVLPSAIKSSPNAIKHVVKSHFDARKYFQLNPSESSKIMATRLQVAPSQVPNTYQGIELPDISQNHKLLSGNNPDLQTSIKTLAKIMKNANMIPQNTDTQNLIDASLLPPA